MIRGWLRRLRDKALGAWHEGPQPPFRLRCMVEDFAAHQPHANRGDWIAFAAAHAEECYRSGYLRGVEALHRQCDAPMLLAEPELDDTETGHDWRWAEGMTTIADIELEERVVHATLAKHAERIEWEETDARSRMGKTARRF